MLLPGILSVQSEDVECANDVSIPHTIPIPIKPPMYPVCFAGIRLADFGRKDLPAVLNRPHHMVVDIVDASP